VPEDRERNCSFLAIHLKYAGIAPEKKKYRIAAVIAAKI
jgi:hypothetical protein